MRTMERFGNTRSLQINYCNLQNMMWQDLVILGLLQLLLSTRMKKPPALSTCRKFWEPVGFCWMTRHIIQLPEMQWKVVNSFYFSIRGHTMPAQIIQEIFPSHHHQQFRT